MIIVVLDLIDAIVCSKFQSLFNKILNKKFIEYVSSLALSCHYVMQTACLRLEIRIELCKSRCALKSDMTYIFLAMHVT